jgi:hydrogenase maturation protein HypF
VEQASHHSGISLLACGGGCFFNKLLTAGLQDHFNGSGITLLASQTMQPGDTAIALGQAWIAAQRIS